MRNRRLALRALLMTVIAGCGMPPDAGSPAAAPELTTPTTSPTRSPAAPSVLASASAEPSPAPNVQDAVLSEHGLFVGSWASDPAPPPINVLHEWVLHVETPDGLPVEGATISLDGDMPAHGHGLPTQPQVSADLGGGDYRVEGMSFQMGGYWIIDVAVSAAGQSDLIRFGLELEAR